jgi:uncharacterized protein YndB with AHSA1/START domain
MSQLASEAKTSPVAERRLILTRVFNAPRSLVYKAWTDPQQLAQWWGPTGFTNPLCELDLKPYGEIRIDMRAPDGTIYPMSGAFREIVEDKRLVFTTAALDEKGTPLFENLNTVLFEDFGEDKTLLTIKVNVLWETVAAARHLDGMNEGWRLTIDRLGEFVEAADASESIAFSGDTSDRELRATRLFNAPRELVYRMWVDPEHVAKWWGPEGFTITIHEMDVRVGGLWRLTMHGPDGRNFPNKKIFVEVVPNERLVYDHVSGPNHRMIVDFIDAGDKTEVHVHSIFASAKLLNAVVKEFGADKGLQQTLDRLGDLLHSQKA